MKSIIARKVYVVMFISMLAVAIAVCIILYFIAVYNIKNSVKNKLNTSLYVVKTLLDVNERSDFIRLTNNSSAMTAFDTKLKEIQKELEISAITLSYPETENEYSYIVNSENTGTKPMSKALMSDAYQTALASGSNVVWEKSYRSSPGKFLAGFLPLRGSKGDLIVMIGAELSIDRMNVIQLQIGFVFIIALLLSFIFSLINREFLKKMFIQPILGLNDYANRIAGGELDKTVSLDSKDEISELAGSMNLISRNLKESFQKVEQYNRELLNQLYTDRLTHLANRRKLIQDLESCVNPLIILFNIDSFQEINDFYGNDVGDYILLEVSKRLRNLILTSDNRLYKMHADEYAVLVDREISKGELEVMGIYFTEGIVERPFNYMDTEIYITLSAGIGLKLPQQNSMLSTMAHGTESGVAQNPMLSAMINADMALRRAKAVRKKYVIYDESMDIPKEFEQNIRWTQKLKYAIKEDRIVPFFQPILNNHNGRVEKYECLVRMRDVDGKIIPPYYFLAVAKKARLYRYITTIMIDKSFQFFDRTDYDFSINLSLDDILDDKTSNYILTRVKKNRKLASHLVFELLETENMQNYEQVKSFVSLLKDAGCKIAIDDFGTGYSNFSNLVQLKVDYIKIDSSLIRSLDEDRSAQIIIRTIASFARELGLETISECVHNKNVYEKSIELGIDYSQGYYFGEPRADLLKG